MKPVEKEFTDKRIKTEGTNFITNRRSFNKIRLNELNDESTNTECLKVLQDFNKSKINVNIIKIAIRKCNKSSKKGRKNHFIKIKNNSLNN